MTTYQKAKECIVICNTRSGYCLTPYKCKSIRQAVAYAKSLGLAYRIFVDDVCVKSGW